MFNILYALANLGITTRTIIVPAAQKQEKRHHCACAHQHRTHISPVCETRTTRAAFGIGTTRTTAEFGSCHHPHKTPPAPLQQESYINAATISIPN